MSRQATMMHAVGSRAEDPGLSPARLTTGQRWRLRRDLVIYLAHESGVSQRVLADVFDLPHSRISVIVRNLRKRYAADARPAD